MPIIIDANCLSKVFAPNSKEHEKYKPVYNWIVNNKGMIVYGGSKYLKELARARKYLRLFRLWRAVGKVFEGNKQNIDRLEREIKDKIADEDFDDPHLVAIVIDTRCRLICSDDKRSIKFVKNSNLYPDSIEVPRYFIGKPSNIELLSDEYVDNSFKPLKKLNKRDKETIGCEIDV